MTHPECLYTAVESSLLAGVAYTTDQTLLLWFLSGALYRYFAVPPNRFPGSAHCTIQRRLLQPQHQKSLSLPAARLNRAVPTACIPPVAQRLRDFDSSALIALDHSKK